LKKKKYNETFDITKLKLIKFNYNKNTSYFFFQIFVSLKDVKSYNQNRFSNYETGCED